MARYRPLQVLHVVSSQAIHPSVSMVSAMNGAPQPALDALVVASVDSEDDELMAVATGAKAAPTVGARALGGNSLRSVHAVVPTAATAQNVTPIRVSARVVNTVSSLRSPSSM